jgi:hypothetical protein
MEEADFNVLHHLERLELAENVRAAFKSALIAAESPAESQIVAPARAAFDEELKRLAVPRVASRDWASELRPRFFTSRLRMGSFYRAAYGDDGVRAPIPDRDDWQAIIASPWIYHASTRTDTCGPMIFKVGDYEFWRTSVEDGAILPGLLSRCFPEMLDLIERELEGRGEVIGDVGDDFREKIHRRLEGVWRRADRMRRGEDG